MTNCAFIVAHQRKGSRMERKNITQPPDWWAAFEREAERKGMSLSAWIGDACRAKLPNRVWTKLSVRREAHRPKKQTPDSTT